MDIAAYQKWVDLILLKRNSIWGHTHNKNNFIVFSWQKWDGKKNSSSSLFSQCSNNLDNDNVPFPSLCRNLPKNLQKKEHSAVAATSIQLAKKVEFVNFHTDKTEIHFNPNQFQKARKQEKGRCRFAKLDWVFLPKALGSARHFKLHC